MKLEDYIQLSGPLFEAVQTQAIFPDPKAFVDSVPKEEPAAILDRYRSEKRALSFDLKAFVLSHFELPNKINYQAPLKMDMRTYLLEMSEVLFQKMEPSSPYSTLISLPNPHPVPGERFREAFYWDSYFVALGLAATKERTSICHIANNFASLINRFGFIPNGNRVYFLSRSQPPFFSLLLDLLGEVGEKAAALSHFSALESEYLFWMRGQESLSSKKRALKHVVLLEGEKVLNRYFDALKTPRPEAYAQELMLNNNLKQSEFYQQRRAVCASGWDFSSRWLDNGALAILNLLPIDLNVLIYHAEKTLASFASALNFPEKATYYRRLANKRLELLQTLFWDEKRQFFFDYHWKKKELSSHWSLAAAFPLFAKVATKHQANCVADQLKKRFLLKGGFVTTLHTTSHQWDAPNGWAPLQWIAIQGLINYGYNDLAKEAATRWLNLNKMLYQKGELMLEKYNVDQCSSAVTHGLYAPQRGFGWTNGVALAVMDLFTPLR